MPAGKMHADEPDIDAGLVGRLVAAQFPQWADLPIRRVASTGTVSALFRLGDDLVARLPRVERALGDIEREQRWLPRLAAQLPVAVPVPYGVGEPGEGFPWPWSVFGWLDGAPPDPERLTDAAALADDAAGFIVAMRAIDIAGAPSAYRGGPLPTVDAQTRTAIAQLDGQIDTDAAAAAWDAALRTPAWTGAPVWVHSDLMPGNLLVHGGRLSAVIDFECAGVGDPACDLIVAWFVLPADVRAAFRAAVSPDAATWARGRGWALSMALIQLPYYEHTNPPMAADARRTIGEVLADHRRDG